MKYNNKTIRNITSLAVITKLMIRKDNSSSTELMLLCRVSIYRTNVKH